MCLLLPYKSITYFRFNLINFSVFEESSPTTIEGGKRCLCQTSAASATGTGNYATCCLNITL